MGNSSISSPQAGKGAGRRRSKWPERVWFLVALTLLVVGGATFGIKRLERLLTGNKITGRVLPDLESVDRIEASPGALRDFNVVIITTDTTRADHLGCYGNRGIETPVLDQLAREGILCSQAITPSPSTLPAHSSLMTGLYPYRHGARSNGTFRVADGITTLAERLKSQGYRTGAAISAFVLDSRFGLDRGFDSYDDDLTRGLKYSVHMFRERAAELTNEVAVKWLRENAQQPFFLWVHYFDPHAVYLPPEPFRSRYAEEPYDGEIAYVDSQIGALLTQLEELGVRDKTLVVYTADHGEGLGEHGEFTHSLLAYDGTLRVPLIFHAPRGLPSGKVITRQTSLVDVMPTVLSLLGDESPGDLDGIDLSQPWDGQPRPLLIETIAPMVMHGWAPLVGIRSDDYKYILAPTPELYDLQADPKEERNLHDAKPDTVRALSDRLVEFLGHDPFLAARHAIDLSRLQLDSKALGHLSELGYVATVRDQKPIGPALRDPKEMIGHWETTQKAINMQAQGQGKEAIPILEASLAEVPGDVFSRSVLAGAYREQGDMERAMANFQLCVSYEPNNGSLHLGIAGVHLARHEFDKADAEIDEALKIEPESAQAYIARGQVAYHRGKDTDALASFEKAVAMDPGSAGANAYNQIGFLHLQAGRLDKAREAFRSSIRLDAFDGGAHDGLANILNLEGKADEALAELRLALRFNPNQPRAMATLAGMLSQKGDQQQAEALCKQALAISPKFAMAHNNLGLIYRRTDKFDLAEKHYREAIQAEPRFDAPHVNLAQLFIRQGKTELALDEFRAAIQASPRNPSPIALSSLGAYHFNEGRYARALSFYRRALQVDADHALAHKQIASIYALKEFDRPRLAAFHLRRSLELDPDQTGADQLREMLARAEQAAVGRGPDPPLALPAPGAETDLPLDGDKPAEKKNPEPPSVPSEDKPPAASP